MEQNNPSSLNLLDNLVSLLTNIFQLENKSIDSIEELQYCFKILILDDKIFNLLAPLLKIYTLRENNICCNLNIKDPRTKMPNLMAIYIVSPTQENFDIIKNDITSKTFENFSINILNYDDKNSKLLQKFYNDISISEDIVNSIYNISLIPIDLSIYHPRIFSLEIKRPYLFLNSPNISDDEYNNYLTNVSNGVFSSLFLMKTLPIIKYRTGYFAEEIVNKIQKYFNNFFDKFPEKKDEFVLRKSNTHTLLIFLDRDSDLPICLHHASSFGSMIIDNYGLCRYKNNINDEQYEIDPLNDEIWNNHLSEPFFEVGKTTYNKYKEFYKGMSYLDNISKPKDMEELQKESEKLANSINNLRDQKIKGNYLTKNSNFYSNLVKTAESRNLGQFYEIEDLILRKRNVITNDIKKKFYELMKKFSKDQSIYSEIKNDLYRLGLIYYLSNKSGTVNEKEMNEIKNYFETEMNKEEIENSFSYLNSKMSQSQSNNEGSQNKKNYLHSGLQFVVNSINSLMTVDQPSVSADIVNDLVMNKKINNFATYNLFKKKLDKENNISYNYSDVIVFFVGGGSLGEFEYIDGLMKASGKNIIYGCDYLYRPCEFIRELEDLGKINKNKNN